VRDTIKVNKQGGMTLCYKSNPVGMWKLAKGIAGWEKMKGV